MTGNVAQVFVNDEQWSATLAGVRAALRPGGYLVHESRRPAYRACEEWARQIEPMVRTVPEIGAVRQCGEAVPGGSQANRPTCKDV